MTEISVKNGMFQRPWFSMKPSPATRLIDPIAFLVALIGAPLLIAALLFWILLIPVVAIPFGLLPYLLFGTPTYLWLLSRGQEKPGAFAGAGILVNLSALAIMVNVEFFTTSAPSDLFELVGLYGTFGCIFAALWSTAFLRIYIRIRRDRFLPNQP